MTRPLLLDLFCKAGGAAQGYYDAGFEVVGVDIEPQPRYPFECIRSDAMALDCDFLERFAAFHASPPCQGYSAMRHAPGARGAPKLIRPVRQMLRATGRPYIIENVEQARIDMIRPVALCGSMFGLGAEGHQLRRHRLFESNIPITAPRPCAHASPVIGVYGGHARRRGAAHGGRGTRDVWIGGHKGAASLALGIDWMTLEELSESIPPAFTKHLGAQLLEHLAQSARAA